MGFEKIDSTPPYMRKKRSTRNVGTKLYSEKIAVPRESENFITNIKKFFIDILSIIAILIFFVALVIVFANISNTRAGTKETKLQVQTGPSVTEIAAPISSNLYALTIFAKPSDAKIQIMNIKPKYYPGIKLEKNRYAIRVSKLGYIASNFYVNIHNDTSRTISLKKRGISKKSTKNYKVYRKGNKVIYKIKGKKPCYIVYKKGAFHSNTCSSHVNSKGMKIYCTGSKKVCKTANEIRHTLARWL